MPRQVKGLQDPCPYIAHIIRGQLPNDRFAGLSSAWASLQHDRPTPSVVVNRWAETTPSAKRMRLVRIVYVPCASGKLCSNGVNLGDGAVWKATRDDYSKSQKSKTAPGGWTQAKKSLQISCAMRGRRRARQVRCHVRWSSQKSVAVMRRRFRAWPMQECSTAVMFGLATFVLRSVR